MSLINRVALSNYVNLNGMGTHLPWEPRFRYEILNFKGQSTAVNLVNGGGKTSIVQAMLSILSRDKTLIKEVHKFMAPSSEGIPTHIQVEFVDCSNTVGQGDLLVDLGGEVGGEKWVFGMSGFRLGDKNEELDYYFYHGTLEDYPPALRTERETVLLPPDKLVEYRERLKPFKWRPNKEEWERFISNHVSKEAMNKMAQFQKQGSSDKGANLFEFKVPHGERYDEAFFYEVVAPELLSGLMGSSGEEDETSIESTVFNTVSIAISTKQAVEKQRKKLDKLKDALDAVDTVADIAQTIQELEGEYLNRLEKTSATTSFIKHLAFDKPVLGIPSKDLPEGLLGNVAQHIVKDIKEQEIFITAKGLTYLLGGEPKHIVERAKRKGIHGRKNLQVIEIICDLSHSNILGSGQKSVFFELHQARKIIDITTAFPEDVDKDFAHQTLDAAFKWYREYGDTNIYAKKVIELADYDESLKKDIETIDEELEELETEKTELMTKQSAFTANEGAYFKLLNSKLFESHEFETANALRDTKKRVATEFETINRECDEFSKKKSLVDEYFADWQAYCDQFGANISPHELDNEKKKEVAIAKESILELTKSIKQLKRRAGELRAKVNDITTKKSRLIGKNDTLEKLVPAWEKFKVWFGDVDPRGLESQLNNEKMGYQNAIENIGKQIENLEQSVQALTQYREQYPDVEPTQQLESLSAERNRLVIRQSVLNQEIASYERKLKELEHESIAKGDAADTALKLLCDENINFTVLHKAIESFDMDKARRKEVLTAFSALLFTPVFKDKESGEQAAQILANHNLPVPAILLDNLKMYCEGAQEQNSARFHKLFVGLKTRAVQCLLDPTLVEREKEAQKELLNKAQGELRTTQERLDSIREDSDIITLVKEACKAITGDAESQLVAKRNESKSLGAKLEAACKLLTDEKISAIRSATTFIIEGGDAQYQANVKAIKELGSETDLLNDEIDSIEKTCQAKEVELSRLKDDFDNIYPDKERSLIEQAKRFVSLGGIAFKRDEEKVNEALAERKKTIEERHFRLSATADDAIQYLEIKESQGDVSILDKILELDTRKCEAIKETKELIADRQKIKIDVESYKELAQKVDELAFEVSTRFKKISTFESDIKVDESNLTVEQRNILSAHDSVFESNCDLDIDNQKIKSVLTRVSDEVQGINVTEEFEGLRGKKKALTKQRSELEKGVDALINKEGLAVSERKTFDEARSDMSKILTLAARLHEIFAEAERHLKTREKSEKESRDTINSRLKQLIQQGTANLTVFKRLVRKNYNPDIKANFIVEADVISEEGLHKLIDEIIDMVEEDKKARERQSNKGFSVVKDSVYKETMKDKISAMLYRRIFTNAGVQYEIECIRKTGKHRMDGASEGQTSAMLLMWAIRLADFAIEKEARNARSRLSGRKVRTLAENILVLDGLFSSLSSTPLIKSALAGIERTRGRFQLIGFIHAEKYENDDTIFSNFIIGKENHSQNNTGGHVTFENKRKGDMSVGFAHIHSVQT